MVEKRATIPHGQLALFGDAELCGHLGAIKPLVPAETEIDFENGETFLSVVGFRFRHTPHGPSNSAAP